MNRPTVLVVDDDPAMREYLGSALRLGGFDVATASDGLAALAHIERQSPDAVLLDLDLPLMNGFAVHAALQADERTKWLPIVILTGTGLDGPVPVAAALGKPIAADDLVRVIFDAIARGEKRPDDQASDNRTIVWLCPECRGVVRESFEAGHPMTSEMRIDTQPCAVCRFASAPPAPDA